MCCFTAFTTRGLLFTGLGRKEYVGATSKQRLAERLVLCITELQTMVLLKERERVVY